VHTKSHNDRHSAALATRSTPEGDPPNRLGTGNAAATTSLGRRRWSRGRRPPCSVTAIPGLKIIDNREMQRRFHADEVIRREFPEIITAVSVDARGRPTNGYREAPAGSEAELAGCDQPSPSAVSTNIYSCYPTAAGADVCWPSPPRRCCASAPVGQGGASPGLRHNPSANGVASRDAGTLCADAR
jgi:hypothetical protein